MPATLLAVLLLAVLLLSLAGGEARAAVGMASSPAATIDTILPQVTVDPLPQYLLLKGGQDVTFHWTTSDIHPGQTAAHFTAEILADAATLADIDYLATFSDATWQYTLPEISSGNVRVRVRCADAFGNTTIVEGTDFSVILSTSGVPAGGLPGAPFLEGNAPNPCNPGTMVRFSLPSTQRAVLELYAADGARVRRLAEGSYGAGRHEIFWDGRDDDGRAVASGTYLLRLTAGGDHQTRKLALVR